MNLKVYFLNTRTQVGHCPKQLNKDGESLVDSCHKYSIDKINDIPVSDLYSDAWEEHENLESIQKWKFNWTIGKIIAHFLRGGFQLYKYSYWYSLSLTMDLPNLVLIRIGLTQVRLNPSTRGPVVNPIRNQLRKASSTSSMNNKCLSRCQQIFISAQQNQF